MERKKVISGRDAARLTKVAGLIGENFKGAEPYTVDKFKADLESGEFAFPGGYPTYFITDDGDCLSYDSAKENAEQIIDAIQTKDNSGWRVVGREVNWEDPDLYCADSGKRIPSAYAEPEEEFESDDEHDPSDDFVDSDPWSHGPDGDMYGESKKSIKLSSLSEGLRREVKKHLKEGKTKLSQMPESVRMRLMKESEGLSQMMNSEEVYQQAGEKCSDARKKGDHARAKNQQDWFNRAIALEKGEGKEKAQAAFDRGYGSSKDATPSYFNEAEHGLENASSLHAKAMGVVNKMPQDSGFGGGPKEHKMGILRSMDPKRMSQSDIETCQDIISGY